jgi:hypothetical protein
MDIEILNGDIPTFGATLTTDEKMKILSLNRIHWKNRTVKAFLAFNSDLNHRVYLSRNLEMPFFLARQFKIFLESIHRSTGLARVRE